MIYDFGCSFPLSSADFWLCLRKFCGKADRGRLAGQRREFKTHRKSTAQPVIHRNWRASSGKKRTYVGGGHDWEGRRRGRKKISELRNVSLSSILFRPRQHDCRQWRVTSPRLSSVRLSPQLPAFGEFSFETLSYVSLDYVHTARVLTKRGS